MYLHDYFFEGSFFCSGLWLEFVKVNLLKWSYQPTWVQLPVLY